MHPRTVFMGSPDFALPTLRALAENYPVVGVVTQPDRPAGRGRTLTPPPVKLLAVELGLPLIQPTRLRLPEAMEQLRAWAPDLIVVAAFGQILRPEVLELPAYGCINVHASLLPRWRGAAPIQRALLAGDSETGITIMRLEAGLDTGPMLSRQALPIAPEETGGSLHDRLARLGGVLVTEALDRLEAGTARFEPQDDAAATYARKLAKSEALIDWTQPAEALERQVRAFDPWPVAETRLDGQQLRIWRAHAAAAGEAAAPGTVLSSGKDGIVVMTGRGALVLDRVQLPGRRAVTAPEFARAQDLAGRVLG